MKLRVLVQVALASRLSVLTAHSLVSVQVTPLPVKPASQARVKPLTWGIGTGGVIVTIVSAGNYSHSHRYRSRHYRCSLCYRNRCRNCRGIGTGGVGVAVIGTGTLIGVGTGDAVACKASITGTGETLQGIGTGGVIVTIVGAGVTFILIGTGHAIAGVACVTGAGEHQVLVQVALASQLSVPAAHSLVSVQVTPLPVKPASRSWVKPPGVLVQVALLSQLMPRLHSFSSVQVTPLPV